jgi:kynurenine/2-aminoadipate aminotransferase
MFVWLKLLGIPDSAQLISTKAIEHKVLLVPGFEFYPNPLVTSFVRAAYSIASEEDIEEGVKRLAFIVKEAQKN